MSLRGRLTVMAALTVGSILLLAAVICFVVMRGELRGQIDDALRAQAGLISGAPIARNLAAGRVPRRLPEPPKRTGNASPYALFIARSGTVHRVTVDDVQLPVDAKDRRLAARGSGRLLRDRHSGGVHLRVMTVGVAGGGAVELGRSLKSVDTVLSRLRLLLAGLVLGGVAIAVALSRVFSRRVIAPITDLTAATEHIEATGDLQRRVASTGTDEVGRLAARFNAMLDRLQATQRALEDSTAAQRQLVADASHELRTPVASLRTNIEVLLASDRIEPGERKALLADVVEQTEELTAVVGDLIDLARGDHPGEEHEDLDLAEIAAAAVQRARRHAPRIAFDTRLEPWPMSGSPSRLGRALNNLLDNALKFSPQPSVVEVGLRNGSLTVRDRGPGVPDGELPHIFDRFYRGTTAASAPGSGLGLAIVRQVADSHAATLTATTPQDGGLLIEMAFPAA